MAVDVFRESSVGNKAYGTTLFVEHGSIKNPALCPWRAIPAWNSLGFAKQASCSRYAEYFLVPSIQNDARICNVPRRHYHVKINPNPHTTNKPSWKCGREQSRVKP